MIAIPQHAGEERTRQSAEPGVGNSFEAAFMQQMHSDFGEVAFAQLMDTFADGLTKAAAELRRCHAVADFTALKLVTHNLKGTASMYGARRLAEESARLSAMCDDNSGRLRADRDRAFAMPTSGR